MHRSAIVCALVVMLAGTSVAQACDTCLRTGTNVHLAPPPDGGGSGPIAFSSTAPAYSSRVGAPVTLFLDLDGLVYVDEDNQWAGRTPGTVPAYDIDGNASTFSPQEVDNIRQVWVRVAEAYSPFNVNVTTVDPGNFTQPNLNTRVVIGGNNAWYSSGAGGVAYVGGFAYGTSVEWRTGWAFEDNLGGGFPKYVADATIHEAGHQFGLAHQAEFNAEGIYTNGYRRSEDGGLTAPNMGVAYGAIRGLWSDGPRAQWNAELQRNVPVQQLDLDILRSLPDATSSYPWGGYWNGFGFREDDWADEFELAEEMRRVGEALGSYGVIEQHTDEDFFRFTVTEGLVEIAVDGAEFGQMLDIVLNLFNAEGELIYTDNPPLSTIATAGYGLDASFSGFLAAGEYELGIASNGGYGDIGQYFVLASGAVAIPEPAVAAMLLMGAMSCLLRRRSKVSKDSL